MMNEYQMGCGGSFVLDPETGTVQLSNEHKEPATIPDPEPTVTSDAAPNTPDSTPRKDRKSVRN